MSENRLIIPMRIINAQGDFFKISFMILLMFCFAVLKYLKVQIFPIAGLQGFTFSYFKGSF